MFSLFETVRITYNGVVGDIVDITVIKGNTIYTVESNTRGPIEGGYGDTWPLFQCYEHEIEKV